MEAGREEAGHNFPCISLCAATQSAVLRCNCVSSASSFHQSEDKHPGFASSSGEGTAWTRMSRMSSIMCRCRGRRGWLHTGDVAISIKGIFKTSDTRIKRNHSSMAQ